MERREFLKQSCLVCLGGGAGTALLSLASCSPLPVVRGELVDGAVRIPLSAFSSASAIILQVPALDYDLAVCRGADGRCVALLLKCTHAETPLTPTGGAYLCDAHGSRFDLEGRVQNGPASRDLIRYLAEEIGGEVVIRISS